jgi:hypothetical protein
VPDQPSSSDVTLIVPRTDVQACDVGPTVAVLQPFLSDPNRARSLQGTLDLRIGGYDDDPCELFELEDVRAFVHALDLEFPYWLYFSSVHTTSLRMIALCFLPPFLTDEGKREHFSEGLDSLLERRWIPALEQVASFAQHPQADFTQILDAAVGYFRRPASSLAP